MQAVPVRLHKGRWERRDEYTSMPFVRHTVAGYSAHCAEGVKFLVERAVERGAWHEWHGTFAC